MKIIAIVGHMGSGKTLLMTYLAYADYLNGRKIFSNYGLKRPIKFEPFNKEFLLEYSSGGGLFDCTVLADEFHIWMDSRNSMGKNNKMISYMINQCRKRSVDFMFTTQHIEQVDIRLRKSVTHIFFPSLIEKENGYDLHLKLIDNSGNKAFSIITDIHKYFKYYDTDEIIDFE